MINKKVKILESMIRKIVEEETQSNAKKAENLLKPYLSKLSQFKPKKMQYVDGSDNESYYVDLSIPGQFENPSLYVDFLYGDKKKVRREFPPERVVINVWFKEKTNTTKYKTALAELMKVLSSIDPKMPVLVEDWGVEGSVSDYTLDKIKSMYE